MKKIIIALLLALTSAWAVDQNPVVEMYPDDMPKSQLVFTLDLSKEKKSKAESSYSFLVKTFEENKNLKHMNLCTSMRAERKNGNLESLLKIHNQDLAYFLVLEYQDSAKFTKPSFQTITYLIDDNIFGSKKWDTPISINSIDTKKCSVNEMSWKFIDFALHSQPWSDYTEGFIYVSPLEEMLFNNIKTNGLCESVTRGVVVQDESFNYNFYSVYNTDNEMNKSNEALTILPNLVF